MSKQVSVSAAFIVSDYATAAAAVSAGRRMIGTVLSFLEQEGAFGEDKEKAARAAAQYKEARLPYIARDRDARTGDADHTAIRSLALDSAMVRVLPANDPLKTERAAVYNAARVDWHWIQWQYKDTLRKATETAKSGDAKAGEIVKDPMETLKDFSKTMTSRNQRGQWIDAGAMSMFLERCRKDLAGMLEGRTQV